VPENPSVERFDFVGSQGATLAGRLHRPAPGTARGSVLLAHCFTCSKDIHTMTRLATGLAEAGHAALRFDFTGLGDSGGDFATKTVSGNVGDLTRAAASLIGEGFGPCTLIGHSLGGAAAILAAHKLKTVERVITIGAPSDPGHVRHLFADQLDELVAVGRADVTISGRTFTLERSFLDDLARHDVLLRAAELARPCLVVHARDDEVVGFEHAEALFAAASEPKELAALDSGGHLLAARSASDAALAAILDFLDRHP
jgi:putative redox protein